MDKREVWYMQIHVVSRGETVFEIAREYGVSESSIILNNEINDPKGLVPGQTLVILYPDKVHTVNPGDT
ncbi:MAG: LysM domain-containing protein, partial [Clostridia bacterium]